MLKQFILVFTLTIASSLAQTSPVTISLEGRLVERGTRKPLDGVAVYVVPQPSSSNEPQSRFKTTTDQNGNFHINGVPEGSFTWIVNEAGFVKLEQTDSQLAGANSDSRSLYLERDSYQVYETTVYGKEDKRDGSTKVLNRKHFMKAAGSGGDPLKAVQDLPGVNRPQSFSSQVLIQGSGPQDTQYLLNNVEVPLVFHFGGITSVLLPEAIDRVEVFQAGYGPEWGRANGGLVGAWTREPRKDRLHGLLSVDTFTTGGLLEGPIGDRSRFLVTARQSYIGQVVRAAVGNRPEFDLTVVPTYSDASAVFESEITERDKLQVSAFGSQDSLQFLLKEPLKTDPIVRGNFDNATSFFRFIPQLTHKHGETATSRFTLGFGRDFIRIVTSDNYFKLNTYQLSARGEFENQFSESWKAYFGFDNRFTWANVDVNLPYFFAGGGVMNPLSEGTVRHSTVLARYSAEGFYARNEVKIPETKFTLLPNLRIDYFSQTSEWIPEPRPAVRYAWNDSLTLRGAGGLYYQPPQPQETDPTFGNPAIVAPRAWHLNLGADKDFREGSAHGWFVSGDAFYKILQRLVVPSNGFVNRGGQLTTENFNNNGSGSVIGFQTQAKYDAKPWSFSAIYTLSKSKRSQPGQPDYPSQYDSTHLIGLLGSVDLPRNWSISGRFRYSTGNPKTPIANASFDADNDVFTPIRGPYFSTRLPNFYQLDLRFDKKWIFDTWILSLYLDIFNVTNHMNQELLVYSYDYKQTSAVQDLPILPTFGLKGEF